MTMITNIKYILDKVKYFGLRKVYYISKNLVKRIKVNYLYIVNNVYRKRKNNYKRKPVAFDKSYFDGNGSNYEFLDYPTEYFEKEYYSKRIKYVSKFFKTTLSGKKILDIGCSDGSFLEFCHKNGFKTFGLDISKDMITNGKKYYPNNKLYCLNATSKYPFLENYFDIITSFDLIEHTRNPNRVLSNIYKHLKKNGIAYIITPNGKQKADNDITHISLMSFDKVRELVKKNKFKILDSYKYKYYPPTNYLFIQKLFKIYNFVRQFYIEQSVFIIQK